MDKIIGNYNGGKLTRDLPNIRPEWGTGLILSRLHDLGEASRKEVYASTSYDKKYGPGYHTSLWSTLLTWGYIKSDGGFVKCYKSHYKNDFYYVKRAIGKHKTPKYSLTDKGMLIYREMMAR